MKVGRLKVRMDVRLLPIPGPYSSSARRGDAYRPMAGFQPSLGMDLCRSRPYRMPQEIFLRDYPLKYLSFLYIITHTASKANHVKTAS